MQNRFESEVKEKPDEELLTMVYEFDAWNVEMLQAVEAELQSRQILPNDIALRKKEMIEEEAAQLAKGKEASLLGQVIGWLCVLGLLGIIIGYNYAFSKVKSKYTGQKFYKYDEDSRDNGSYIFYISLSVCILVTLYIIIKSTGNSI